MLRVLLVLLQFVDFDACGQLLNIRIMMGSGCCPFCAGGRAQNCSLPAQVL